MEPVGDGVQEAPGGWQVVVVAGLDGFPPVVGGVGCRKIEHLHEPGFAVAAVVGEGLAGPFAGDQDSPPGVAEVLAAMCLAFAGAGTRRGRGFLGWMP